MDTAANAIITKYLFEEMTQELCDVIMADVLRAFGPNADAQVTLDTDDSSIEIKLKDLLSNVRTYKVGKPSAFMKPSDEEVGDIIGEIEDRANV